MAIWRNAILNNQARTVERQPASSEPKTSRVNKEKTSTFLNILLTNKELVSSSGYWGTR